MKINYSLILKGWLSLCCGLLIGVSLIFILPKLNLDRPNQLYQLLGIKYPQVIGFQPFWTLEENSHHSYQEYLSTYTYFALNLEPDGQLKKLNSPQEQEPGWTTLKSRPLQDQLQRLKENQVSLSLLVHNSNQSEIEELLEKPQENAQTLIKEVAPIMKEFGFTDLNLDIESFQPASPNQQQAFTNFVKSIKRGIEEKNLGTLTLDITPVSLLEPRLTNAQALAKIADSIVLMTYDYHYFGSFTAGPVAPISGAPEVREHDIQTTLEQALKVIPAQKIILGVPLYGYEYETINKQRGAATIPGGTSTASLKRISQIMNNCQNSDNCQTGFDQQARQAYLIFPDQEEDYYHQIYYENQKSIKEKIKLAEKHHLAGLALWALGYEDETILEPIAEFKNSPYFYPPLPIVN